MTGTLTNNKNLDPNKCMSLVLLLDASGSVNNNWSSQNTATANAISSDVVLKALSDSGMSLAVQASAFSDNTVPITGWHIISNKQEAQDFATAIRNKSKTINIIHGGTKIGQALNDSIRSFNESPCKGERRVIDISTDGADSDTINVNAARDSAELSDIIINGIAVNGDATSTAEALESLKTNAITRGTGFAIGADWKNYEKSLLLKLSTEIAGSTDTPAPNVPDVRHAEGETPATRLR